MKVLIEVGFHLSVHVSLVHLNGMSLLRFKDSPDANSRKYSDEKKPRNFEAEFAGFLSYY
jgi:hypothetical protein